MDCRRLGAVSDYRAARRRYTTPRVIVIFLVFVRSHTVHDTKAFDEAARLVGEINADRPAAADIIAQRVRPSVAKRGDGRRGEILISHCSGHLKSSNPVPIPDLRTTRDVAVQQ